MRICFVNPVGQIGGAERVMLDTIASIRALEPEHEIRLLLMEGGPLEDEASARGAGVEVIPAPKAIRALGDSAARGTGASSRARLLGSMLLAAPPMWAYARRLRRAIERIAPDAIHSNGLKCHLLLSQAKLSTPIVWHIHDFVGSRPMMAKLLRRFSCGATPVAISNAVAQDIRNWLPNSSPTVVLNGIDTAQFSPGPGDAALLDRLAGLTEAREATVRIGLTATYARWKGQDIFLRAAAQVLREPAHVPVRFYLIGGPIYSTRGSQWSREDLHSMVRELGLSDDVGLVPFQRDPVPIYRGLDVVVHASTHPEPFGLTVAEAMSSGKPVIVSAAGGSVELFRDGVDAVGVAPGNAGGLAEAMQRLIADSERRAILGAAARETAVQRFDRSRMGGQLLAVYRNML